MKTEFTNGAKMIGGHALKVLVTIAAAWFVLLMPAAAQRPPAPARAPVSPEYQRYVEEVREGRVRRSVTREGHGLGLKPSPLDLSHLKAQHPAGLSFPASYDLRTTGKVTSVKDQGSCGTCWAFAAFGSEESILRPGETRDFSENNLKNLHGFDNPPGGGPCYPGGGNAEMSMAYLARWSGPVNETDDPYQQTDANTSPPGLPAQKHVQDVVLIPGRGSSWDNGGLKAAVMTYGGVSTNMRWLDSAYNSSTASYYYTSGEGWGGHSVTLAGWDDNYSRYNFNRTPAGDGAFLIKNSWGPYWGQAGYFWVSYYDTQYAVDASYAFSGNEPTGNYSHNYQYDELGWTDSEGYYSETGWFANVFTAVASEPLRAVAFYVASGDSPYTIRIYTGVSGGPTSGTLAETTSGTMTAPGYRTVVLPSPVALTAGTAFSVVVTLTTPGYLYPIPEEAAHAGYSSRATASPGQSYISSDGVWWTDTTSYDPTANVCLKAFTGSGEPVAGLRFVPLTPCRVVDTRDPSGPFGGPVMSAGETRSFAPPAHPTCGIPSTAQAYSLNVTVAPRGFLGYLSIWPAGQAQPLVSTLNSYDGRIKASAALVPAGTSGAFSVFVTDSTDVVLDINGYFVPPDTPSSLAFYPVTPCRVSDTRDPGGPLGGPYIAGGSSRTIPVQSACGIPAEASAYSLNFTAVPQGPLGYITTWPTGTAKPLVSTLNAPTGTPTANAAIVPAGTAGSIDVYATNDTDLIVDINGYFAAPGTGGLSFYPLAPCRVVDTRNADGPYGGPVLAGARSFAVPGSGCGVPEGSAYSLSATVVPQAGFLGYLTLWPTGSAQPLVSTLNSYDGSVVSNAALVPAAAGSIDAFATDTTHLILDINGLFAP